MKSLVRSIGIFTLASSALVAQAFYPVDGWWYNPAQSGRGFQIEMQDDEMFIAAFHYRPNGEPVWWVANGRYDDSTGRMEGLFQEFENGQCPGCPFTGRPELVENAGSPVMVEFHSAVTATLHWDGESIPIQRQYWRFDPNRPNLFLFGEFHFTSGALGIYFGDRIVMDDTMTDDDGTETLIGRIRDGSAQRIAVGRFDEDLGMFVILVDSSESFFGFFVFDMTKDRLEGRKWTFRKDEDLSGNGLPFIGHRVASRAFVQTGVGPHAEGKTPAPSVNNTFGARARDELIVLVQEEYGRLNPGSAHPETGKGIAAIESANPAVTDLSENGLNDQFRVLKKAWFQLAGPTEKPDASME